jgi:hypothetical protein
MRTSETLKTGHFMPPEKSLYSIVTLYGAKRQRILTYSRHPNWGLQSKGVAPLF